VKYERDELLVSEARADWNIELDWATADTCCLGPRAHVTSVAKSYYEAADVGGAP